MKKQITEVRPKIMAHFQHLSAIVSRLYDPSWADNMKCRKRRYTYLRAAVAVIMTNQGAYQSEVGALMGGKDHTTIHGYQKVHFVNMTTTDRISNLYQQIYMSINNAFLSNRYLQSVPKSVIPSPYVFVGLPHRALERYSRYKKP
jgi:hypothetical protein